MSDYTIWSAIFVCWYKHKLSTHKYNFSLHTNVKKQKKKKYKGHSCTMELLIEPFHIHAQDPLGILGNKLNWEEWKEMEKHFTKKLMM